MNSSLREWIEGATGARITATQRVFSGGSRQTVFVTVRGEGDAERTLVVKWEPGTGSHADTEFSLEREFVVYRALAGTSVPVPYVLSISQDRNALLMERLPGSSDLRQLSAHSLEHVARDFVRCLAELHLLDVNRLELGGLAYSASPAEAVTLEVDRWSALAAARTSNDDPLQQYALAWLRSHLPSHLMGPVLVQGDTGPGNFLVDGQRVSGLVDWEFSHLGDPMDDLAWVRFRARNSVFAEPFERHLPEYERLTGWPIDSERIAYFEVLVIVRNLVTTAIAVHQGGGAMGLAGYIRAHALASQALAPAILRATGLAPHEREEIDQAPPTTLSHYYEFALTELNRFIRPCITEREAKLHLNGATMLIKWLKLEQQLGPALRELDDSDKKATFGGPVSEAKLLSLAEEGGRNADATLLQYLARRSDRRAMTWAFDPSVR
jgi:aminoglycoside phosphotransferase (APT) family kinase protein